MQGLFDPFSLKSLELKNRIVMLPMCMYMAGPDGMATPWHQVHYASRAAGGCGLIIQEATAVEKRGRLSNEDLGIWSDVHVPELKKLVNFVHGQGGKMAIQLAHGGRKAWPGGEAIIAPSAIPFTEKDTVPEVLSEGGIAGVVESFRQGACRAVAAGYDAIEVHGAHGYLIHQFLSPVSNQRTDGYGGSAQKRLRFPLEVVSVVKEEMPASMPLIVRISAVEYMEQGYTFEDMLSIVKAYVSVGADIIDVSTGGMPSGPIAVWPGYQLPYAEKIKKSIGIPVIGCGLVRSPQMAEEAVRNGRIDLMGIGRALLSDPYWSLTAANTLRVQGRVPKPYWDAYPPELR